MTMTDDQTTDTAGESTGCRCLGCTERELARLRAACTDHSRSWTRVMRALGLPQEADTDDAVAEIDRLRAEVAALRARAVMVMPEDWAEQIAGETSHTITRKIQEWIAATQHARLEVDGEASAWYIRLLTDPVARTTEQHDVHVDWTADGRMIGVEILTGSSPSELPTSPNLGVPEAEHYEQEREELARAIHKKVNSPVQRRTVPFLVGDAERAVSAVIEQGWAPAFEAADTLTPAPKDPQRSGKGASFTCPNTPGCAHPSYLHDDSGDLEDPRTMCCVEGCPCGRQEATDAQ